MLALASESRFWSVDDATTPCQHCSAPSLWKHHVAAQWTTWQHYELTYLIRESLSRLLPRYSDFIVFSSPFSPPSLVLGQARQKRGDITEFFYQREGGINVRLYRKDGSTCGFTVKKARTNSDVFVIFSPTLQSHPVVKSQQLDRSRSLLFLPV